MRDACEARGACLGRSSARSSLSAAEAVVAVSGQVDGGVHTAHRAARLTLRLRGVVELGKRVLLVLERVGSCLAGGARSAVPGLRGLGAAREESARRHAGWSWRGCLAKPGEQKPPTPQRPKHGPRPCACD